MHQRGVWKRQAYSDGGRQGCQGRVVAMETGPECLLLACAMAGRRGFWVSAAASPGFTSDRSSSCSNTISAAIVLTAVITSSTAAAISTCIEPWLSSRSAWQRGRSSSGGGATKAFVLAAASVEAWRGRHGGRAPRRPQAPVGASVHGGSGAGSGGAHRRRPQPAVVAQRRRWRRCRQQNQRRQRGRPRRLGPWGRLIGCPRRRQERGGLSAPSFPRRDRRPATRRCAESKEATRRR